MGRKEGGGGANLESLDDGGLTTVNTAVRMEAVGSPRSTPQ